MFSGPEYVSTPGIHRKMVPVLVCSAGYQQMDSIHVVHTLGENARVYHL